MQGPTGAIDRRNRDRPLSAGVDEEVGPSPEADLESVVASGHAWLRFPAPFEALFQADTLASRRKLLMICGLLGIVSIYLGTFNIAALNPDITTVALRVARANVAAGALGFVVLCLIPMRWRRTWQAEGLTAFIALGTCAGVIYGCSLSRADTTFTHSAVVVSVVMYTCIAARQRFRWSLACTLLTFLGYAAWVKGSTPTHHIIVLTNLKLMTLSFAFALAANYTFEHRDRHSWLLGKLKEQRRLALQETSERLYRLSIEDPLTGLVNRREFDRELEQAWARGTTAQHTVAMLMVDVDYFKRYNDSHGHPAGDACLIRVAQMLAEVARDRGGVAARLGGEEFGLLMPDRTLVEAQSAGQALCERVREACMTHRASPVAPHVTVSIGVAQVWLGREGDSQALIQQADRALYEAKEQGRDRVCVTEPVSQTAASPSAALSQGDGAGIPEPAVVAGAESAYAQTLQGRFRWLRFPAEQEAQYQGDQAPHRRLLLLVMSLLGLGIYQIYLLSSLAMFPDLPAHALAVQFGFSAAVLLLAVAGYAFKALPSRWREALFSLCASVMAVMTLWLLSQSHQLTALSFAASLALVPLFAGAGAQQPFWFASVPAAATCLAAAWLLKPVGGAQALVFQDSLLMIVNNTVFALILAYTLEHGARKAWLQSRIEKLQSQALITATQRLHELSTQDSLTGLSNRRQFDRDAQRLWDACLQDERPLAMLIIDVDFFKLYNDGYGHPAGDRCLRQIASIIQHVAQMADALAFRLGGEEFGVLLPGAGSEQIESLGDQVCAAVRQAGLPHLHSKLPDHKIMTTSVGAASLMPIKGGSVSALITLADDALYQAKNAGRNRVEVAPEASPQLSTVAGC